MDRSTNRLALLLVALSSATLHAADAPLSQYRAKPGERRTYRTVQTTVQSQSLGGMKLKVSSTETDVAVWSLSKIDEKGRLHWQVENKSLNVKLDSVPFGKYTFDSAASDHDTASYMGTALSPIYSSLSGAFLEIVHDSTGRISRVKQYEELVGKLMKGHPYALQFAFGGTNEGIAIRYQEVVPILAKKAVKPGDSWTVDYNFELPRLGKVQAKKSFQYAGIGKLGKRKTHRITYTYEGEFDFKGEAGGAKFAGPLPITRSKGEAHFDDDGVLLEMKSTVTFSGSVGFEIGGNALDVPSEVVWTLAVKREE